MGLPQAGEVFLIVSKNREWVLTASEHADGNVHVRPSRELNTSSLSNAVWELLPAPSGRYFVVDQRHKRALVSFMKDHATHRELEDAREACAAKKDTFEHEACWEIQDQGNGDVHFFKPPDRQSLVVPDGPVTGVPISFRPKNADWHLLVLRSNSRPERFVVPTATRYWTIAAAIPAREGKPLYLSTQGGASRDGTPLIFARDAASGAAHFRFVDAGNGRFRLINRDNGQAVRVSNAHSPKYARLILGGRNADDVSELFALKACPDGAVELVLARDQRFAVKAGGLPGLAENSYADMIGPSAGGIHLEIEPAYSYRSAQHQGLVVHFGDEPFDYTRMAIGGLVQLAAGLANIPGAGAVFNALWPAPERISFDVMSRFRDDILRDIERFSADTEVTRNRNTMSALRKQMLVDYTTTKRTSIDEGKGFKDSTVSMLNTIASEMDVSSTMFIPPAPWTNPLPEGTNTLLAVGMPLFLTCQVERLMVLAEAYMLEAFDTRRATRIYLDQGNVPFVSPSDNKTPLELVPLGGGAVYSGTKIALCSSTGKYFSVWQDAPGVLTAIADVVDHQEKFVIERVDASGKHLAGEIRHNDRVVLIAANGMQLSAVNGGGGLIHANTLNRAAWEVFTVIRIAGAGVLYEGDTFGLKIGAHFISAGDGGGRNVNAVATFLSGWENLTALVCDAPGVISHGTRVALRDHQSGMWLSALDGGGKGVSMVNRVSSSETFTLESLAGERDRAFAHADAISIRTSNGHYLQLGSDKKPKVDSTEPVTLILNVVVGTGASEITAERISGFVSILNAHAADIKRTVNRMVESLSIARINNVWVHKDTWEVGHITAGGGTAYDRFYVSKLMDKIGNRTLLEDSSREAYDNPATFAKEQDRYQQHLLWDYRTVTYSAIDAVARLDALPEAVGAACRRLNSEGLACSQFRYAALKEGVCSTKP